MEPLINIWLELSILLILAVVAHYFVTKLGQPLLIIEIIIGIMIGPSLFGLVKDTSSIAIFAEFGILVMLFAVGLECDLRMIYTRRSLTVAFWGVIIPWVGGFLFGATIMGEPLGPAVFLGAALTATSTVVATDLLIEHGLLDKRVGRTIIGAAVVDDVLAMGALSISAGIATGGVNIGNVVTLFIATALFIVLGGFLGAKYMPKVVEFVEAKTTKVEHSGFLFALGIMFLYVVVATLIGISSIIGAFIAGAVFPEVKLKKLKKEFHTGTKILAAVFTPIFFISIGVIVNLPEILSSYWCLIFGLLLSLVAIVTKVIGCGLATKLFQVPTREALYVGFAMVPRCEVALAIALFGFSSGIISQSLYSIIVLMAILTTIFVPPILRGLMERKVPAPTRYKKKEILALLARKF